MGRKRGGRHHQEKHRGPGREPKLTRQRLLRVLAARRCGMSVTEAAAAADITAKTHYNWMLRGREDREAKRDTLYAEYFHRVPLAEAKGVFWRRSRVMKAIRTGDAEARERANLALKLQSEIDGGKLTQARRRAILKGLTEHGQPTGPMGGPPPVEEKPVPVELSRLTGEEFTRYQALSAKARASLTQLPASEFEELKALLRKAQGEDVVPLAPTSVEGVPGSSPAQSA